MERPGALPEEWDHFDLILGLATELLPIVADRNLTISPTSKLKEIGKVPSLIDRAGHVHGLPGWPARRTTGAELQRWRAEPKYSLALQARTVRAFDIDCPNSGAEIADDIERTLGRTLPMRFRENSGKRLLAFRLSGQQSKRVLRTADGAVELLADGQEWVAAGQHVSGVRYQWRDGLPGDFPLLTTEEVERVWDVLQLTRAIEPAGKAKVGRQGVLAQAEAEDPVARFLYDKGMVLSKRADGSLSIVCPNQAEHTTDSSDTACVYFLPFTMGYQRGHVHCLHAHCANLGDDEMLRRAGYVEPMFEVVTDEDVAAFGAAPVFARNAKTGKILSTVRQVLMGLSRAELCGAGIRYDTFRDETQIAWSAQAWRPFRDTDYTALRDFMETAGEFKEIGADRVRECVHLHAERHEIDSAQQWLALQTWDGVPRVERFLERYWGVADSPYARSVSRYIWTVLPGRTLVPGVQADMVPVFIGAQGAGKTRGVKALAPTGEQYVELRLDMEDDKWSRALRGKMVGEIGELRGLASREAEEIKAKVSRCVEEWTPKYVEHNTRYPRRLLLIGTTNQDAFLADETGERRWLPVVVGNVDVVAIERDRGQLWAEGAELFRAGGVDWHAAEQLARNEHQHFRTADTWEEPVSRWADDYEFGDELVGDARGMKGFTTGQALTGAVELSPSRQTSVDARRMGRVLKSLKFTRARASMPNAGGVREWVWRKASA